MTQNITDDTEPLEKVQRCKYIGQQLITVDGRNKIETTAPIGMSK